MAGNEQRPTDDVEAHRYRWNQDTEATDEDEAGGGDDTGGHAVKYRG